VENETGNVRTGVLISP